MAQSLKIECVVSDISKSGEVASTLVTKEQLDVGLAGKANLVDGRVPESQLPMFIASSFQTVNQSISGLSTAVANNLQIAKDYAEAYTNEALLTKADLGADGKVPSSQLPNLAQDQSIIDALAQVETDARQAMLTRTDELEKSKADLGADGKLLATQVPGYRSIPDLEAVVADIYEIKADKGESYTKAETLSTVEIEQILETSVVKSVNGEVGNILIEHSNLAGRDDEGAHLASSIVDASGKTQQEINDEKANSFDIFGRSDTGVLKRIGTIYESRGTVEKQESRVIFHDFRPLVIDGSHFNTDGANLFWGLGAGNFTMRAVPDGEVVAGRDPNLQCSHNVGFGVQALNGLTYGYKNVALGNNAGRKLQTGAMNVMIGQECARESTNASFGVYVGAGAGQYSNGAYNVTIGYSSMYNNVDGNGNISIGRNSLFDATTGDYNINIGEQSGRGRLSGSYNTEIGKQTANNGITTASNNTVLGARVSGLENVNGQVVLADGNGTKYFVANPNGSGQGFVDIVGREATAVNLSASDAQTGQGTTIKAINAANTATSFSQVIFQCRVGQPYSRIVQWGGASPKLSLVNNTIEAIRIDELGNIILKANASVSLTVNDTIAFEKVSDTQVRLKMRGADGVTRITTLTLA